METKNRNERYHIRPYHAIFMVKLEKDKDFLFQTNILINYSFINNIVEVKSSSALTLVNAAVFFLLDNGGWRNHQPP